MKQFTDSVQLALDHQNWYGALLIALTLPDICGWLEKPTSKSKSRYVDWYEKYLQHRYTKNLYHGPHIFLNGNDCYALRCAALHQGGTDITDQQAREVLEQFQFVAPKKGVVIHCNQFDNRLQLQVDVFCKDICSEVERWGNDVKSEPATQERLKSLLTIDSI
jgi:hypothetical protein